MAAFKKQVKVVFVSYGSREKGSATGKANAEALQKAGIKSVIYESPNTAHEWLTWRRSLSRFGLGDRLRNSRIWIRSLAERLIRGKTGVHPPRRETPEPKTKLPRG